MKKIILITVIFLGLSMNLQAQFLKFGIKGGVNIANQNGSNIIINSTNYKTSEITNYHVGLVAEMKLVNSFAIQPELLYTTHGANYKNAVEDFENQLGYISIPLMAKIKLNKVISLELGPQASFLLSEKNNFDSKDTETFDFAANGGLGFSITKNLFVQARYILGLTDVSKDAEVKNSVVQISAGILF